jgi:acyl-CoA thioesterase-1
MEVIFVKYKKLMVFGDSILQGITLDDETKKFIKLGERCCVDIIASKIDIPVENYSHFGYTTEKSRRLLKRRMMLDDKKGVDNSGALAIIALGGNDIDYYWDEIAREPKKEHLCKVQEDKLRANLLAMVKELKSRGIEPSFMTMTPLDPDRYYKWLSRDMDETGRKNVMDFLGGMTDYIYKSHEYYNGLVWETANRTNSRVADVRGKFLWDRQFRDYYCSDGVHPNAKGHELMAPVLMTLLGGSAA